MQNGENLQEIYLRITRNIKLHAAIYRSIRTYNTMWSKLKYKKNIKTMLSNICL